MSQRSRPAPTRAQNGRQQVQPQQAPTQYDEQQDQPQEEEQQDQEEYGAEYPSQYEEQQPEDAQDRPDEEGQQYDAQDASGDQDIDNPDQEDPSQQEQTDMNGAANAQNKLGQKGKKVAKGRPVATMKGQNKSTMNKNGTPQPDHSMAAIKAAAMPGQSTKGSQVSHQNALHFMAKTASEYLPISDSPGIWAMLTKPTRQRVHPRTHPKSPSPGHLCIGSPGKHSRSRSCCTG
jgi:hypothetical protein